MHRLDAQTEDASDFQKLTLTIPRNQHRLFPRFQNGTRSFPGLDEAYRSEDAPGYSCRGQTVHVHMVR
jgi:hypothetical protein